MNIRTLTLVLGSAITVAVGGVSATACSSSSGTPATGKDASASSSGGSSGSSSGSSGGSSGSSSGSSGGSSGSSSGSGDGGTGPDCGSIPSLHVDEAGTIYCGFSDAGSFSCPTGQECCLGGEVASVFSPEMCATYGSFCSNGTDAGGTGNAPAVPIECIQVADCRANGNANATACCLQGATAPAAVPGCGYSKSTHGSAIVCEGTAGGTAATACAAGEIQICSSQADCPTGTTCTPGKWKIYQIGFCQ